MSAVPEEAAISTIAPDSRRPHPSSLREKATPDSVRGRLFSCRAGGGSRVCAMLSLFALTTPASATTPPATPATKPAPVATLCEALETAARRNGLPNAFFARLIWQESRFDPLAVSPKGAQGVAQFMPGTAADRGLADPFDTTRALDESAVYLKELREKFGNLGLAAAAYNAGPRRVARWLAGKGALPDETIGYVEIVTGHAAFEWRGPFSGETKPPTLPPPSRASPASPSPAMPAAAARRA